MGYGTRNDKWGIATWVWEFSCDILKSNRARVGRGYFLRGRVVVRGTLPWGANNTLLPVSILSVEPPPHPLIRILERAHLFL